MPTALHADHAHALALLAEGNTAQHAAAETGLKLATIVQAARRQGWTVHPTTGLAADLSKDDGKPALPADVAAIAATRTPKPRIVITTTGDPVDELLANARVCDDKHVQAALNRAEAAIGKLRDTYAGVAERRAAEEAAAAARQAALDEVAELERKLADARQRAKAAGATIRATRGTQNGATDADIRAWALGKGIECNRIGRVSRTVREQYENAHRPVAV
ncbi:Lsr2 family DNA-binding protein (plasmid) [Streptosporangium sandarakinum]|uniref:Lsr2 family DNA-binding protein n=1 Tax=Streptosporangium sandarakinum TaxID=1260955 RepID=UPI003D8D6571